MSHRYQPKVARRWNIFLLFAIVFGLVAAVLVVVPYFIPPQLVNRRAALQLGLVGASASSLRRPRAPADAGCVRYTVQVGDKLSELAKRFSSTQESIALINNLYTDILEAGQALTICRVASSGSSGDSKQSELGQPIDLVLNLTYPQKIRNRKPQWITLSIDVPQSIVTTGENILADVSEATTMSRIVLPPPEPPRLPNKQKAVLMEQLVAARLTGAGVAPRSGTAGANQVLSKLIDDSEPLVWQWLFVPPVAGDHLFGLDVFSSGEFEVLDAAGTMVSSLTTREEVVWVHDFTVSVDEIFGITRQWWLLISGAGALVNLLLGITQLFRVV